jgi:hypothetical protein
MSRRAVAAFFGMASCLALAGCLDADFDVRAANGTGLPVAVDLWINHTANGSWHAHANLPANGNVPLGHFKGPPENDYDLTAMAGGLRYRELRQLGDSYSNMVVRVGDKSVDISVMVV